MRDYAELVKAMRYCSEHNNCGSRCPRFEKNEDCVGELTKDAADAIEELLAVFRDVADFVIHYADEDNVGAEVLCRKLNKIGLIEKDGAWWTLPEPPKEGTE